MMNKTVQNSVKRMKNEQNRQVAYNMPIVNKDMKKNDEMVRKFFESMKGWWKWESQVITVVLMMDTIIPETIGMDTFKSFWSL